MKRFLALLLILATMLGLCACGKSDPRKALSDMGITNREDQDALIEAANSLYSEDTSNKPKSDAQMEKIYEESRKQYGSQLEGTWVYFSDKIEFHDKQRWLGGNYLAMFTFEGSNFIFGSGDPGKWLVEDGKILCVSTSVPKDSPRWVLGEMELMQFSGVDILRSKSDFATEYYVRQEDLGALYDAMYLEVELNSENVKDYYELIEAHQDQVDDLCVKTGKYRRSIFLCNTAYKEGLYCIYYKDISIEVHYPRYDYTKGNNKYQEAGTKRVTFPNYQRILDIYTNFWTEEEAAISPEELTIGNAEGTLKYLRPEFIDHVVEDGDSCEIYDVFGNCYRPFLTLAKAPLAVARE